MKILFASETEKAEFWVPLLEQALAHDRFVAEANNDVDIGIVATPPAGTLARLRGAKLIQSLWMGVEKLLADPGLPPGIPIARLIDELAKRARSLDMGDQDHHVGRHLRHRREIVAPVIREVAIERRADRLPFGVSRIVLPSGMMMAARGSRGTMRS